MHLSILTRMMMRYTSRRDTVACAAKEKKGLLSKHVFGTLELASIDYDLFHLDVAYCYVRLQCYTQMAS